MFNLGRWLAAWACFGMLLYPAVPTSAAPPSASVPTDPAPAADSSRAAPAEPSSAVIGKERRPTAPLDMSYIPAEAAAAVIIHPQPLLTGPNAEWMPVEILSAVGMKRFGVDPVQIDEALAVFIPPPADPPGGEPGFGLIVRFKKAYSKDGLLATLPGALLAEPFNIYTSKGSDNLGVYLPDERTIVFGPRSARRKMLAAKNVDSPLTRELQRTDCSETLTVVASFDAMRDLINGALRSVPQLPPALEQFRKAPALISSLTVRADLTSGADFSLTLHAADDQAAIQLLDMVNAVITMGRQILLGHVRQRMHDDSKDPIQEAANHYTTRIVNQMFDRLKPIRDGHNVRVAIHTEAGAALMGMMVALLMPAVQSARAAARRAQSSSSLRQIGLAMRNYEAVTGRFPARAIFDKNGKPLLSWRVQLLPYLEQRELYDQFRLDEPWNSEHNKPLIARMPDIYLKPGRSPDGKTNYLVPVGAGTAFEGDRGMKISEIADGTRKTILAVEADDDRAVIWTKPDDLPVAKERPLAGLSKIRPGGFEATFADGTVGFISSAVDPQAAWALFTCAGGEVIPAR